MKSKKAVSGIVTTVLLIALVIAATSVVWVVVNNLISGNIESAEACFGILDKVTINSIYTCYDYDLNEVQFSIKIKDIDVDEILVSISGEGTSNSYTLANDETTISGILNYTRGDLVKLPDKNAGLTYFANTGSVPDLIEIAPVINNNQCKVSDSMSQFEDCRLLVG